MAASQRPPGVPQTKPAAKPEQLAETHVGQKNLAETAVHGPEADDMDKTVVPAQKTQAAPSGGKAASGKPSAPEPAHPPAGEHKTNRVGDFEVVKRLGKGGMGEVYLARQVSLDRLVALKTLSKDLAKREDFVQRFLREARSMAKLQHPNIVQVYAADSSKGTHFVAIEFIDGQSLQKWMDQLGKLSVGDALHVALVCGDALRHAHELNIVHRDIKPDNILITKKGEVKVADFGLAKAVDEDVSMTQSGTGLGTPLYMAPEQARNAKHVDQRCDIYALGCTLYYMVTGELPFTGQSTLELIQAKEKGQFKPASRLNPEVPERLDLMIDKMMAKEAQHRYATCEEVLRDLQSLQMDHPALSFIEKTMGKAVARRSIATHVGGTSTVASRVGPPVSSAEDAARKGAGASQTDTGKMWIVQFTDRSGKLVIKKMTTAQVLQGVRSEMLDLKTKAKEKPNDPFLPLAQFMEFADLMDKRAIRAQNEARATSMKETFARLDKQERRRKRWRWLFNLFDNVKGLVSLILWLALVAGVIIGGGWGLVTYGIPWIKGLMGS